MKFKSTLLQSFSDNIELLILIVKETIAEEEYYQMALLKTILGNSNAKGYLKMICVITVVYLVM